jgi:glycosyltransferase involved in cell wall biosynthesis
MRGGWDLVHAHYGFHSALVPLLAGARPLVVTFHRGDALSEPRRNRLYGALQRSVAACADHLVCVSRQVQEAVLALGARPERTSRLSCGVNTDRFAPAADKEALRRRLGLPPGRPTVVFSGALSRRKGVDLLTECARRLPDVSFLFVGEGPLKTGPGNCRFVGAVANSQMPQWLNAGDIYALPSRSEGTPVALLEALACGLPAVCADVGDCDEAVRDAETGFVIPPEDVAALTERVARLVADEELRRRMGRAARADVTARYGGRAVAGRLKAIYERLLGGSSARGPECHSG